MFGVLPNALSSQWTNQWWAKMTLKSFCRGCLMRVSTRKCAAFWTRRVKIRPANISCRVDPAQILSSKLPQLQIVKSWLELSNRWLVLEFRALQPVRVVRTQISPPRTIQQPQTPLQTLLAAQQVLEEFLRTWPYQILATLAKVSSKLQETWTLLRTIIELISR